MGGNIPGGNYLDGNYPGGGITRAEFDRWEFSARGVADSRLVFFIRHFVFLSVFILKTLAFHYKNKAIFGCSVSDLSCIQYDFLYICF